MMRDFLLSLLKARGSGTPTVSAPSSFSLDSPSSVTGQLQDLGNEILKDSGHVDLYAQGSARLPVDGEGAGISRRSLRRSKSVNLMTYRVAPARRIKFSPEPTRLA
jgi:hypothetical protein